MEKRKRFNANRICSSDDYMASKIAHINYVRRYHEEHYEEIQTIIKEVSVKKRYFTSCFGELIEITKEEAMCIKNSTKIIIK